MTTVAAGRGGVAAGRAGGVAGRAGDAAGRWGVAGGRGLALAVLVTVVALTIRLPQLQEIPLLTDETAEVATSLAILDGARPLIHSEAYRGPAWAYLLAAYMRLSGGGPASPREFAALLGALTAGAACLLAIELAGGRLVAGAIAGAGVATATGLTTLGSHVAWSNNATPLWVVLGAWCLVRASPPTEMASARKSGPQARESEPEAAPAVAGPTEGPRPWNEDGGRLGWWSAAGALWGLALHSHPSAVAPMAGAVGWWLSSGERRRRLRTGGPWIAATALGVVLLPLIVHNVVSPMDSLRAATVHDQPVARDLSAMRLLAGTAGLARQVARVSGAGAGDSDAAAGPSAPATGRETWRAVAEAVRAVRPAMLVVYAGLLLGALTLALARGPRLVGAMALAGAVLLVVVNTSWNNFYDSRYVAFIAVLGWVAVGVHAGSALGSKGHPLGKPVRLALIAGLAALIAYPLLVTAQVYRAEAAAGRTNTAFLREAQRMASIARQMGAPVLIDENLRSIELGGGGNGERALVYLTRLHGERAETTDETEMRWFLDQPEAKAILAAHPETAARLDAEWRDGASDAWRVAVTGAGANPLDPAEP